VSVECLHSGEMGYTLAVMPVGRGEDPGGRLRRLVAAAERRPADVATEARRRRLADLVMSLEPGLVPFPRTEAALAAALPDYTPGQIAFLARTIQFDGWPGVQIELADEWVSVEIATWPELTEPGPVHRLTRIVQALCDETGWALVDCEQNAVVEPTEGIAHATERSAEWGRRVARDARGTER